jgi:hypothetical protein
MGTALTDDGDCPLTGTELARQLIAALGPEGLLELREALRSVTMAAAPPMRMTEAGTGPRGPAPGGPQGPQFWPPMGPATPWEVMALCGRTGMTLVIGSKVVDPMVMRICAAIGWSTVSAHMALRVAESAATIVRLVADPAAGEVDSSTAAAAFKAMSRVLLPGPAARLAEAVIAEMGRSSSAVAESFRAAMRRAGDVPGDALCNAVYGPDGPPAAGAAAPPAGMWGGYDEGMRPDPCPEKGMVGSIRPVRLSPPGLDDPKAWSPRESPESGGPSPAPPVPEIGRQVLITEEVFLQVQDSAAGGSFASPAGTLLPTAIAPETHCMVELPLKGGGTEPVLVPRGAVMFLD